MEQDALPWGGSPAVAPPSSLPVIPKGVGRRLLPALIGLRVQEAVVSVDGVAQVIPPLLLA